MKELTINLDYPYYFNEELSNYLSSLKGIMETKVNFDDITIYIKYNPNLTTIEILKMEILLFTSNNIPSIIGFNKHSKSKTTKYSIIIKDLCCEFCLKGIIEELLDTKGIEKAYIKENDLLQTDDAIIYIEYDNNIINKNKINETEKKLNTY